MDLWEEIAGATPTGFSPYFEPGNYHVRIERFFLNPGFKGLSFVLESEIVWSADPDETGPRSWVVSVGGGDEVKKRMGQGNIKGFIHACFGVLPSTADAFEPLVAPITARCAGQSNPLSGLILSLNAVVKPTKPKHGMPPGVFTVHNWHSAPGHPSADVSAILACAPLVAPNAATPRGFGAPQYAPPPPQYAPPQPPQYAPPPPQYAPPQPQTVRGQDGGLYQLGPNGYVRVG